MQLYQIIIGSSVTEKSVRLQESNQHVFWVHQDATKIDVMNAIRALYGVAPTAVRMMRTPKKVRMVGRNREVTKRRARKKAIVTLPEGKSIELISVQKPSQSDKKTPLKSSSSKTSKK